MQECGSGSLAKTLASQGQGGKHAWMFDPICERLASRPDDRESAELLAQIKRLRRPGVLWDAPAVIGLGPHPALS